MTHRIPEYYHYVSELLSNILDNVGYSHEDRDWKVRLATDWEVFMNMKIALNKSRPICYIFGSRGEGSTGPGLQSDIDFFSQYEECKAVTDLTDCHPDKCNFLMVKDNFTHPGYIKLQTIRIIPVDCIQFPIYYDESIGIIRITPDYIAVPVYHEKTIDKAITLDTFNRNVFLNTLHHIYGPVSGPAITFSNFDTVHAVRCSQWPRESCEWFQRGRFYGWPTPRQIENARLYGCFATPVGHPDSSEHHVEWRLSFSLAERDLTRSFEGTVMKVYILLKIIKKTFIEPVLEDAFSSYHCKVCMLWMRERTPCELWSNENLLYCLILCIRQLYEWATTGICPDYFIATNNIYDRKIVGAKQFHLVQILRHLLSADCSFLLEIKCSHLGQLLTNRIIGLDIHNISNIPLISQELEFEYSVTILNACNIRTDMLNNFSQYYTTLVDYLEIIIFASKHLSYIMPCPLKYAMMVLFSQLGFHIATVCKQNACFMSREEVDHLVALASSCLSLGINSDVASVRLKLCGMGMELGNYDLTEICLQHFSDYQMRYMYSATMTGQHYITGLECNMTLREERLLKERYNTEELLQTQVAFSVVYVPSEISITPAPLRMEMFRSIGAPLQLRHVDKDSWYDWGVVDSLVCLYFFQYLNFSTKGKERHKQAAMGNMIDVIRTEPKILHRDTALNLLGYSFMQENQLTTAFICFTQSLKIRPYHNAAKFYLGLLFKRVHVTHRRHVRYGSRTTEIAS